MARYLTLDTSLVTKLQQLPSFVPTDTQTSFLNKAVTLLEEGGINEADMDELQQKCKFTTVEEIEDSLRVAGMMLWELVKAVPPSSSAVEDILTSLQLPKPLVTAFVQSFETKRRTLLELKSSLHVGCKHFYNMDWRLDLELARRSSSATFEPKYAMKLSVRDDDVVDSYHLTANYANMKRLHEGLKEALDEISKTHCQRVIRYII
jgi:hypothetical protein